MSIKKKIITVFTCLMVVLSYSIPTFASTDLDYSWPPDNSSLHDEYVEIDYWDTTSGLYGRAAIGFDWEGFKYAIYLDDNDMHTLIGLSPDGYINDEMTPSWSYNCIDANDNGFWDNTGENCARGGPKNYMWAGTFNKTALRTSTIPVFENKECSENYLRTGDKTGIIFDPDITYNHNEVYFESFYFEVHDSNKRDNYYIDFYYEPCQSLLDATDGYVELTYELLVENSFLEGAINTSDTSDKNTFKVKFLLRDYPTSYRLTMNEILSNCGGSKFNQKILFEHILGDELFFDWDAVSLDLGGNSAIGMGSVARVDKAYLSFDIKPCIDVTYGISYTGRIDFLDSCNSYYNSNVPDEDGTYTTNGDETEINGYYYTDVSTDGQGNNIYNYYYINDKGISEEVTDDGSTSTPDGDTVDVYVHPIEVNINVDGSIDLNGFSSGSGGSDNNNTVVVPDDDDFDLTIEDDDYTWEKFTNIIKDGFGYFDNSDTAEDNDGFTNLLEDTLGGIDEDLSFLLQFGMGSTVVICLLRNLLGR